MILRDLDFIIHPLILCSKLKVVVLRKSGRHIADLVFTNIFMEAKIICLVWEDHWAEPQHSKHTWKPTFRKRKKKKKKENQFAL